MLFGTFGKAGPAFSPFIGAQAGANDLAIAPGAAVYPAAKATVFNVSESAHNRWQPCRPPLPPSCEGALAGLRPGG